MTSTIRTTPRSWRGFAASRINLCATSSARIIMPTTVAATRSSPTRRKLSPPAMHTTGIVKHLQSNAPSNMVPARVTFTDETSIFLGGKEVRAKYFGRAHTNGDAFVYFPAHRLVHSGDSFASAPTATPLIDYPGGASLIEWTKTLDAVMKTWD